MKLATKAGIGMTLFPIVSNQITTKPLPYRATPTL